MEFKFIALTDIWTGGIEGQSDKLHVSGIKGSIRWWYEAVIRAFDVYACDPSSCGCELSPSHQKNLNDKTEEEKLEYASKKICPACYLFGCTGWRGKFNIRIHRNGIITNLPLTTGVFSLEFLPIKVIDPSEDILLRATLKIIARYGAIGGKTTFKPSENFNKNSTDKHHLDYGIIDIKKDDQSSIHPLEQKLLTEGNRKIISSYLANFSKQKNDDEWPDLQTFWFAPNQYLNRQQINAIVGRSTGKPGTFISPNLEQAIIGGFGNEDQGKLKHLVTEFSERDTGSTTESKKIFCFHGIKNGSVDPDITRCFGYPTSALQTYTDIQKILTSKHDGKIITWEILSHDL